MGKACSWGPAERTDPLAFDGAASRPTSVPCEQLLFVAFSLVQADARPPRSTCPDRWTLSLTTGCPSPLPRSGTPPTEVRTSRRQCPPGLLFLPLLLLIPSPLLTLIWFSLVILITVVCGGLPACLCLVIGHLPPAASSCHALGLVCIVGSNFSWWFVFDLSPLHFWSPQHTFHGFMSLHPVSPPAFWLSPTSLGGLSVVVVVLYNKCEAQFSYYSHISSAVKFLSPVYDSIAYIRLPVSSLLYGLSHTISIMFLNNILLKCAWNKNLSLILMMTSHVLTMLLSAKD